MDNDTSNSQCPALVSEEGNNNEQIANPQTESANYQSTSVPNSNVAQYINAAPSEPFIQSQANTLPQKLSPNDPQALVSNNQPSVNNLSSTGTNLNHSSANDFPEELKHWNWGAFLFPGYGQLLIKFG